MKKISIISPCYNEEKMVELFFSELNKVIGAIHEYDFEIIIVNDGSSDTTLEQLTQIAKSDNRVSVIDLNRNFGKEIALTAGINHAVGDAIIIVDFDLQDPLSLIPEFLSKWSQGFEAVVGVRTDRSSDSFLKRKTAEFFYQIYNLFAAVKIPKNAGDCRLLDRVVVEQLKLFPEKQRFMKGLFAWVGAKSCYVNYVRQKRDLGSSKFSGWKLWNFAIEGITSFGTLPIRIWTYIGLAISLISFFYSVFIIARTIIYGIEVPGYSSLIVVVLFLGGIQIMGIGIIGEYLGRTYMESKNRPLYLVRKIIKKE
jgi:glycosyltransferase involved in cell wall biosynthesis